MRNTPNPDILGRILLLQSSLHTMPSNEKTGEFICRGISEVPGVNSVDFVLARELVFRHSKNQTASVKTSITLKLSTSLRQYGSLVLYLSEPDLFEPYRPYLDNTVNLISLMLENKHQELDLVKFATDLEFRINKQTANLEKANKALRQSELKFRTLVDNIPGAIYRCALDKDWTMHFISHEIEDITGYPATDFIENTVRTYASTIHEDDQAYVERIVNEGVDNDIPYQLEYRILTHDNQVKWVYEKGQAIRGDDDTPAFLDGAIFDITDTKQAEEKLHITREHNRVLKDIAVTANIARDVKHALEVSLHQLCEYTQCPVGHVFLPADDGTEDLVPSGIWHITEPQYFNMFKEATENVRFPPGIGLPGRIFKSQKVAWISNIENDSNFPRTNEISNLDVNSGYGFPVIVEEKVVAVFEFFSKEEKEPDKHLLKFIEQARTQLSYVILRKQAEGKLMHSEANQRAILQASLDPLISIDSYGKILFVSDSVNSVFGWSEDELIGQNISKLMPEAYHSEHGDYLAQYRKTGKTSLLGKTRELTAVRKNGSFFPCEVSISKIKLPGKETLFTGIVKDISERKKTESDLRDYEQRLRIHAQQTPMGVIEWDLDFKVTEWNPAAEKIFGYSHDEAIGMPGESLIPKSCQGEISEVWQALLSNAGGNENTNENITKNGKLITCDWYNTTMVDVEGDVIGVASLVHDASDRIQTEEELRRLATYDTLTNLPNRSLFDALLQKAINSSNRTNKKHAILFLDLDNFKNINDSLGHSIGDILLSNVANRLIQCTRKDDCVSRFGGDEFVILLNNIDKPSYAADVAKKIMKTLSNAFILNNNEIVVTPSIGIVFFPDDGNTPHELLRNADTAMYYAKNNGRGNYQFFTQDMNRRVRERMDMEGKLRHALQNADIQCHYQPKVDIKSGQIVGVESLARWFSPDKLPIKPDMFIPIAEETGLIIQLDQHIIASSLKLARDWIDKQLPINNIAINLSTHQFRHEDLIAYVDKLLREFDIPKNFIEFEITELGVMENTEKAIELMFKLKERGISLTIDDFGTGYSSLSYLKRFPVDTLKIDISFIRDMTSSEKDKNMVASIIGLAHNLDIKVVAEGVETTEQLKILKQLNCDFVQGYLFSKAVSSKELETLLTEQINYYKQA